MLDKLKRRLPDATDDALLLDLLEGARMQILAYTGRDELPEALGEAQLTLAAIAYNRMGMEGESAHSEGGVSRSSQALPEDVRRLLNPWRLARGVGR